MGRYLRCVRKVGRLVVQVGLVWFGQTSEAEFRTVSESVSDKGRYRAARAAKNRTSSRSGQVKIPFVCTFTFYWKFSL